MGHTVICVDRDEKRLEPLRRGESPIHEAHLPELLRRHAGRSVTFSDSISAAVRASEVIFIAVGTPPAVGGESDLSQVEAVSREIAESIDAYRVIVEKSTVPVHTSGWIDRVIAMNGARRELYDVVSNPEFLREGTAVRDFLFPDRIVVGADSQRAAAVMQEIYGPLTGGKYGASPESIPAPAHWQGKAPLVLTSTKSAELIKHASNAFLAMKISFINAVANLCEASGADVEQVKRGIGADSRIGQRFLNPGIGYGGSCFPKDLQSFRHVARECGYEFSLLDEVIRINDEQRKRFVQKVRKALWTLKGKRIAVLGLAFKGGTDDIRESPAIEICRELLAGGCTLQAYDPAATERARDVFHGNAHVTFAPDAYSACEGGDALLALTDWAEFAELDLDRIKAVLRYPIVLDGRNIFSPQTMEAKGFTYYGIGRATALPASDVPPESTARRRSTS